MLAKSCWHPGPARHCISHPRPASWELFLRGKETRHVSKRTSYGKSKILHEASSLADTGIRAHAANVGTSAHSPEPGRAPGLTKIESIALAHVQAQYVCLANSSSISGISNEKFEELQTRLNKMRCNHVCCRRGRIWLLCRSQEWRAYTSKMAAIEASTNYLEFCLKVHECTSTTVPEIDDEIR